MNHSSCAKLRKKMEIGVVPKISIPTDADRHMSCSACETARAKPAFHPRADYTHPVDSTITFDTCGPIPTESRHGHKYFLIDVDVDSRYVHTIPITDKAKAQGAIHHLIKHIDATSQHIPILAWSDNARKFLSQDIQAMMRKRGIQNLQAPEYDQEQNGILERVHLTLMDGVPAAIAHSGTNDNM